MERVNIDLKKIVPISYTLCSRCELSRIIDKVTSFFPRKSFGYNLGTPALKPYKREIKTHQNDTNMQEKAM
jgi:hypothetical protein